MRTAELLPALDVVIPLDAHLFFSFPTITPHSNERDCNREFFEYFYPNNRTVRGIIKHPGYIHDPTLRGAWVPVSIYGVLSFFFFWG